MSWADETPGAKVLSWGLGARPAPELQGLGQGSDGQQPTCHVSKPPRVITQANKPLHKHALAEHGARWGESPLPLSPASAPPSTRLHRLSTSTSRSASVSPSPPFYLCHDLDLGPNLELRSQWSPPSGTPRAACGQLLRARSQRARQPGRCVSPGPRAMDWRTTTL